MITMHRTQLALCLVLFASACVAEVDGSADEGPSTRRSHHAPR